MNVFELTMEIEGNHASFAGSILVHDGEQTVLQQAYGLANRSEQMANQVDTRYGMASGCKIFTAVAICKLVERGLLTFETPLHTCMDISGTSWSQEITIHHLLTHSSGVPDYFDEEYMTDYSELWQTTPMYTILSPRDMLPLFQDQPMKFNPGERFSYNNSGYILLGIIVENVSGMPFHAFVTQHVFEACGMRDSGYYRLDQLPERTATGYMLDKEGAWRTNMYSIPIMSLPDGGAFTTTADMDIFWTSLVNNRLLTEEITRTMLTPFVKSSEYVSYGYGVWINTVDNEVIKYYVMGCDPGVGLISSLYMKTKARVHVLSNLTNGASKLGHRINELLFQVSKR
ncbi:beta-lactamase family protein [Paenibacillus sp. ACRRX]|uniref:serine hydrolase domain-containing protein n=1 Tax=unclassified Paenibacillus TaxID=185978 RepID=UPI001EF4CE26|nr:MULTISPECIES: serine hydrolase domain-containing protein [unclassified Paenibacillus]MCG7407359.1 beta-lactamase family protein [Paenibacillus sp. ACRRX]MDK8180585.1 serine hydrolase domain-containing protein [Paenibacillus sp. UMB4589-SE434]